MKTWLPLAVAVVLNAGGNVLLKIGAKTVSPLAENASMWAKVANFLNAASVVAIILFAANVIAYRKALDVSAFRSHTRSWCRWAWPW